MSKFNRKAIAFVLVLATALSLLVGCGGGGGGGGGGGASKGLEVDPAEVAMPMAEKVTIKGLTNFPAGTESEPNNRNIFKRL